MRRSPLVHNVAAGAWWEREGLCLRGGVLEPAVRLDIDGHDPERIARAEQKPVFIYSGARIRANLTRLTGALAATGLRYRIFYAMKSNRYAPLLAHIRGLGLSGVDVCSPDELLTARRTGFAERDITYTSTVPSDADLAVLARHPDIWLNCDSLAAIARVGAACPGRDIGLRINTGLGLGYRKNPLLQYSGASPTKFGIYRAQFAEALDLAASYRMTVRGLHFHSGCGFLTPQLPMLDEILGAAEAFISELPELAHINIGGGLGIPLVEGDEPLDLDAWAAVLRRHYRGRPFEIRVEPGDYVVKDSGALVLQVVAVEEKQGVRFVYVDGGFNLHMEPAFYGLPLQPVPCRQAAGGSARVVTIAGNINEALDVFGADVVMPEVAAGDYVAFLNAGGYGSSMSSSHCLRGNFAEYLLP
jgi:diaminopimelate decarboxylase